VAFAYLAHTWPRSLGHIAVVVAICGCGCDMSILEMCI
jgi:hypothetical protein